MTSSSATLMLAATLLACGSSTAIGGDGAGQTSTGAGASSPSSVASSATATISATGAGGGMGTGGAPGDFDGDGLDDSIEQAIAADYFPFFSINPKDKCARHGVLFRATPHPANKKVVALWYDVLYEKDCGANGHAGDDEVFSTLVDPAQKPPKGLLALRAISHQGTPCEHTTRCGSIAGCKPCATGDKGGLAMPLLFASVDKHGNYAEKSTCDASVICDFGGCALAAKADAPALINAGEPAKPLVHDLTDQGFITSANGWTEMSLFHYDPWAKKNFGGAGNVTADLDDKAFLIDPTNCN